MILTPKFISIYLALITWWYNSAKCQMSRITFIILNTWLNYDNHLISWTHCAQFAVFSFTEGSRRTDVTPQIIIYVRTSRTNSWNTQVKRGCTIRAISALPRWAGCTHIYCSFAESVDWTQLAHIFLSIRTRSTGLANPSSFQGRGSSWTCGAGCCTLYEREGSRTTFVADTTSCHTYEVSFCTQTTSTGSFNVLETAWRA